MREREGRERGRGGEGWGRRESDANQMCNTHHLLSWLLSTFVGMSRCIVDVVTSF